MWTERLGQVGTHCPRYGADLRGLRQVSGSGLSILLTGSSGTGKELLAQAVHRCSGRRGKFVAINCASLPDHLIESELFGHVKGAFTGAGQDRAGALLASSGGTLFLDEVGDAPLPVQAALLRALESKRVKAVGSEHERPVDLRVVAATSRGLFDMMTAGSFRPDLYYRLAGHELHLPDLAERKVDIPDMAREILSTLGHQGRLSVASKGLLTQRSFPGNARELRNLLERATAPLAKDEVIHAESLTPSSRTPPLLRTPDADAQLLPVEAHRLLGERAESYLKSGLLLIAPNMPRRAARTWERALLLILLDQGADLSSQMRKRARRLFARGWQSADAGAGARSLGKLLGVEVEVVDLVVRRWGSVG